MQSRSWFKTWWEKAIFPTPINFWRSGKKGVTKEIQDCINGAKLKEMVSDFEVTYRHLILRAKNTGAWLNMQGTTVIGPALASTEFCDYFYARYDVPPLIFKTIVMAMPHPSPYVTDWYAAYHKTLRDKLLYLDQQYFPSHCVRCKPLVYQGCSISEK